MRAGRHEGGVFDILLTALAPIIWGTTYIVTTEWLPPGRPFTAALLRVLPAGLLLLLWSRRWLRPGEWGRLLVLATLNIALFQALLFVAAYRLPGGLAAVLDAIQPLIVMALIWVFDGYRPRLLTVIAAVLGVIGMAMLLLARGAGWDAIGVVAALLGASGMAVGTWLTRRWNLPMPVLALTGWQLLLGGLMLLPLSWSAEGMPPVMTTRQVLAYAYLCLFGAVFSYALFFRGLARISPVAVTSLGLLSPVTSVIIGWLALGQAMHGSALSGLLTVLASVLVVQWTMQGRR